jgi:Tol biopolymer transport system component
MLTLHADGRTEPVPLSPRPFGEVDVSPDGQSLAISVLGANANLWIYDLNRRTTTRLTDAWDNYAPVWHPSGDSLAFSSNRGGKSGVWMMAADGTGQPELLVDEGSLFDVSWSPDGKLLSFSRQVADGSADIWTVSRSGGQLESVITSAAQEFFGTFSPDGRYMAYVSDESGRAEVHVQPFPPTGRKWRLSEFGGTDPAWSPDGRKLYFWQGHRLMVVPIESQPTFVPARARVLIETEISDIQSYDVFPDGQRFLVIGRRTDSENRPDIVSPGAPRLRRVYPRAQDIQVVVNWFSELER